MQQYMQTQKRMLTYLVYTSCWNDSYILECAGNVKSVEHLRIRTLVLLTLQWLCSKIVPFGCDLHAVFIHGCLEAMNMLIMPTNIIITAEFTQSSHGLSYSPVLRTYFAHPALEHRFSLRRYYSTESSV